MKWYLLLIFGVCCISTSAILITLAGVPPTQAAFYRNFFAALFWLIPYGFTRPFAPLPMKENGELVCRIGWLAPLVHRLNGPVILMALGFFFALDLWAWHRAILYIGAGPATLIGNLQVVFVSLLAVVLFGERLKKMFWPGTFLALLGIGMLTLINPLGSNVLFGLVSGVFTALTYSVFIVFLKYLEQFKTTPQQTLFWLAVFTALFLLGPTLIEDGLIIPDLRAGVILMAHALISSVVGWWVIVTVLRKLPVAAVSTLLLLQPLLTNIWGHLFLGQGLVAIQVVGIFLALFGIRLANWGKS
ncbi:MAG: DMT family transporter [Proteobacteria bacterium]|nr:DMT family transporter [Pseudomonadota bacterium]MBU1058743.1 DMT family transporter [Pseudomonadota bacterium]